MTLQNHHHAALRRRRGIEGKQNIVAWPTPTALVATPARSVPTPPKVARRSAALPATPANTDVTPAKPSVAAPASSPPVTPSLGPSVINPSTSSVPPPSNTLNLLLPSASSAHSASSTSRAVPSASRNSTSTSPTASVPPSSSGGVSTGAVVGGIIGGFVALGLIGAALFLFLRRMRGKKDRNEEAFNVTKFRQSAVILDGPAEKRNKPRPPTMIEPLSQSRQASQAGNYTSPSDARYGTPEAPHPGQNSYDSAYPGAYGTQPAYEQYPPPPNPYGYVNHEYPPQPQYPPQPHCDAQQYGAYASPVLTPVHPPDFLESGQDAPVLPNPFVSSPSFISETVPKHYSSNASTTSTARDLTHSSHARSLTEDNEAPPAYETTTGFADYKPDVKARPGSSSATNSASGSGSSGVVVSSSQTPTTASASAAGASTRTRPADTALSSRPLSGTSAITIVYDIYP
ncbi:hypothetical protein AN958_02884 [Leucoagaricus sp. SymC.cos]|nr:hypothetical protein AN958_02884 [Leucoagaricus sp. SymC.cos]